MRTRRARKLLGGGLGVLVLAAAWLYLAPVGLGGSTSYVVTDGISMEPRFHAGDLALVRSQAHYTVGEIVAYHSRVLHTIVLHRIVARDGSRYVFKGDNNKFLDFEHPARSQLIGALWLHLPGVGADLRSLRSPALLGALAAVAVLLLTGGAFTRQRRRRRRRRADARGSGARTRPPRTPTEPRDAGALAGGALAVVLLALLPCAALALLAFSRPTSARLPVNAPYRQSGALTYTARATPGPVYPENRAVTGEPLFTHVIDTVTLRYQYRFHAAAPHTLSGNASLAATISSSDGWQTTLPLGHPVRFHRDHALLTAKLDLSALLALLARLETSTAVSGTYTLSLLPRVQLAGSVDALPLHTTFGRPIQFSLNRYEAEPILAPAGAAGAATTTGASGPSSTSPFLAASAGATSGLRERPQQLPLPFVRPSVASARRIALAAGAVLICALLALLAFARPARRAESAVIRSRYGRLIVPVERVSHVPGAPVIDVADIASLVRIAERYERSILHERDGGGDAYWVSDESGQFRYALAASATAPVVEEQDEEHTRGALDELVNGVYADELQLGGVLPRLA